MSPDQWNVGTSDVCSLQAWPIQTFHGRVTLLLSILAGVETTPK